MKDWNKMFYSLLEYAEHNDFEPSTEQDTGLAGWYNYQVNSIKRGLLSEYKTKLIKTIKFKGPAYSRKWIPLYEELINFRRENPNRWPNYDRNSTKSLESKLSVFCQVIRKRYRENELSDYWFDKFVEIKFNFEGRADSWIKYYNEIKQILEEKNSVSSLDIGENAYSWIIRNKKLYEEGLLTIEKSEKIEELNLQEYFQPWDSVFKRVQEWIVLNGKIPTRSSNKELHSWLLLHLLVKLTTPCCFKLTTLRELS